MEPIRHTKTARFSSFRMYKADLDKLVELFQKQCETVVISDNDHRYDSLDEMRANIGTKISVLDIRGEKPGVHFLLNHTEYTPGSSAPTIFNELRTEEISDSAEAAFLQIKELLSAYEKKNLALFGVLAIEGFKQRTTSPTIEQACDKYLADAKARELREPTLYKFRLLFRQLQEFAKNEGLVFVSDFNLDNLRQFRASWPNKNFAARKKLEATRTFFRFCNQAGWIAVNPALSLKPAKRRTRKSCPSRTLNSTRFLRLAILTPTGKTEFG